MKAKLAALGDVRKAQLTRQADRIATELESQRELDSVCLVVDMDMFYAAVEIRYFTYYSGLREEMNSQANASLPHGIWDHCSMLKCLKADSNDSEAVVHKNTHTLFPIESQKTLLLGFQEKASLPRVDSRYVLALLRAALK